MKTLTLIAAMSLALAAAPNVSAQTEAKKDSHAGHGEKSSVTNAIAILQSTKGSEVKGTVRFTKTSEGIKVEGEVTGLTPGKHGFHVHQFGDTSAPDGTSAGGHFNPTGEPHGAPDQEHRHAGDFGNIEANESGTAKISFVDKKITFDGPTSILGRGLVVHAKADDLKSQPTGDAGDRVAVAVIGVAKGSDAK